MAGEYGEPCGYMSGDLLLTSQVPQAGNLETMMRILINSAGTLCAFNCTPPWGDRLLRMATLLFGSRSKSTGTEWWVCRAHQAPGHLLVLLLHVALMNSNPSQTRDQVYSQGQGARTKECPHDFTRSQQWNGSSGTGSMNEVSMNLATVSF